MDLPVQNVINVSVSLSNPGIPNYNTSNLALFTRETFDPTILTGTYMSALNSQQIGQAFGTLSETYAMALAVFAQQPNILTGGGQLIVIPFLSGETLAQGIARMQPLVSFFGIMQAELGDSQTYYLNAGTLIQGSQYILFIVSNDQVDISPDNLFDNIRQASLTQVRCLYYGATDASDPLAFLAAYAGRALSTDFSGSNTTQNMHLKQLAGILPDDSMTQTFLDQCQECGADVYVSLGGDPAVFTSGANKFFDQVYNLWWAIGDLIVNGFNFLAQTGTKIPQTESGMSGLRGAYRKTPVQGVVNGYIAPGTWTDEVPFGNPADFLANVLNLGYYLYSVPISQQSPANRAARQSALCQVAWKEAGGINSSNVIVSVNA